METITDPALVQEAIDEIRNRAFSMGIQVDSEEIRAFEYPDLGVTLVMVRKFTAPRSIKDEDGSGYHMEMVTENNVSIVFQEASRHLATHYDQKSNKFVMEYTLPRIRVLMPALSARIAEGKVTYGS